MRGELCISFASFLSLAALIMLIFAHVGQINTSRVPRGVYMARLNVSGYGDFLHNVTFDPINGLYTANGSAPLGVSAGLRQHYDFGLYSYCAYVEPGSGICSNHTVAKPFKPSDTITSDMSANYSQLTTAIITGTTFSDSGYLSQSSRAAFWMIFLGTITTALALVIGLAKHNWTFFISALLAAASSLLILIGAAVWTAIIKKCEAISNVGVSPDVTVGMEVSIGAALYLIWASFACLFASMVPYMVSCCTYRG